MTRITKGIVAHALVTVCIFMQVVVMLPHHHHEGSSAPCINMFHCGGDCGAAAEPPCDCGHRHDHDRMPAGDGHHHDPGSSPCALSHLDMVRIERERIAGPAELVAQFMTAQAIHICPVHDTDAIDCTNTINQLDRKRLRTEVPRLTSYIATALPPRAPSFTV